MASKQAMAQRSQTKVHFDHRDMDYYLSWILGREAWGASDTGECMDVAARIVDGDPVSWQREWLPLAEQVEKIAETARRAGNLESARSAYLRACTYYRAPLFMMPPTDPAFRENWQKMQACFRQAAALSDPPIEAIQVPYQGRQLAGYFQAAEHGDLPRPTLLIIGGIETFAEDCYLMSGPAALSWGYHVLTVDLPGQGMNPEQGLFLEARSELPLRAVVDYALSRPEIDPQRLALFGFSWGGHIVLRTAQFENRLWALIANPATYNMFSSALAQQKSGHGKSDPVVQSVFQQLAWRFGVELGNLTGRLVKGYEFFRHARADCALIGCPTLCMAGESEASVTLKQTRTCYTQLPHPLKKLAILTAEEGGAAHCQVDNLPLLNRTIFDWLNGIIEEGYTPGDYDTAEDNQ